MTKKESIHWGAPTLMLGSFVGGIALAVGHHCFYQRLAGNTVPYADHGVLGVSRQKLYSSIGTALAFLVKACLAIAASTAYVQLFWMNAKRQATNIASLDALLSAMRNVVCLLDATLWWRYPLMLCVALTIW